MNVHTMELLVQICALLSPNKNGRKIAGISFPYCEVENQHCRYFTFEYFLNLQPTCHDIYGGYPERLQVYSETSIFLQYTSFAKISAKNCFLFLICAKNGIFPQIKKLYAKLKNYRIIIYSEKTFNPSGYPHKYRVNRAITVENIQKLSSDIFIPPHSTSM